jgi:hypothetical protein
MSVVNRDILVRIRIHGSVPLTYGSGFESGSGSRYRFFSSVADKMPTENKFFKASFLLFTF